MCAQVSFFDNTEAHIAGIGQNSNYGRKCIPPRSASASESNREKERCTEAFDRWSTGKQCANMKHTFYLLLFCCVLSAVSIYMFLQYCPLFISMICCYIMLLYSSVEHMLIIIYFMPTLNETYLLFIYLQFVGKIPLLILITLSRVGDLVQLYVKANI